MICNISIHFCRILTYFNNNTIIILTIIIHIIIIIIMSSIIATITTVSIIAIKGVSINIIVSWLLIINPKQ